jgi:hypothetical protein
MVLLSWPVTSWRPTYKGEDTTRAFEDSLFTLMLPTQQLLMPILVVRFTFSWRVRSMHLCDGTSLVNSPSLYTFFLSQYLGSKQGAKTRGPQTYYRGGPFLKSRQGIIRDCVMTLACTDMCSRALRARRSTGKSMVG